MEELRHEWFELEQFVGYKVPMLLKLLLWKSGYDSILSMKQISMQNIGKLEEFIQKKRNQIFGQIFAELNHIDEIDRSVDIYENQEVFELLPGHRTILLSLPNYIDRMQSNAVKNSMKVN